MKIKQLQILLITFIFILIIGVVLVLQKGNNTPRPSDQLPTVVTSVDVGALFVDPFLRIQALLPESFEAGARSQIDGWDSLTIVPVGSTDKPSTYPFVIDYRTRKSQKILNVSILLQNYFKQPFVAEKFVIVNGQSVQQFQSTGDGEAYRAVVIHRLGQDVMINSRARDAGVMATYVGAYDAFISGMQEGVGK